MSERERDRERKSEKVSVYEGVRKHVRVRFVCIFVSLNACV